MKKISEVEEINNDSTQNEFTLPTRGTLNCLFSHNGDSIIRQIKDELPFYNGFNSREHNILFNIIGNYISDVNLTSEERIYSILSKYIDNKLNKAFEKTQNWIVEVYSHYIQEWLEDEFSEDLIKKINEKTNNNLNSSDLKSIVNECITNKFR